MLKKFNFITGIAISAMFLILFNMSSFAYNCNEIRTDTIRLHIIAQSDSEKDQQIKYIVRDELLKKSPELLSETTSKEEAEKKLITELESIENYVNNVLKNQNVSYRADVTFTEEYFDTREYENGTKLPAGKYLALKIKLGDAQGKNWWCVIFPSLCLPAVQNTDKTIENVYSVQEKSIITSSKKYEIRFRFLEYIEEIKNKVDNINIR